jgi:hypothetical protein
MHGSAASAGAMPRLTLTAWLLPLAVGQTCGFFGMPPCPDPPSPPAAAASPYPPFAPISGIPATPTVFKAQTATLTVSGHPMNPPPASGPFWYDLPNERMRMDKPIPGGGGGTATHIKHYAE